MTNKKYAILGDIHSNLEALQVVLKDAKKHGVTSYVCVGDIVGYNTDPAICVDMVRDLKCVVVSGNHDHYCSHDESLDDFHPLAADVIDWTRHHLSPEHIQYLKNLKLSRVIGGFTIVHSTLDMPDKWGYVFDPLEADANFSYQNTSLCFHGHTHMPVIYEKEGRTTKKKYDNLKLALGKKYFINVGSVGQPRDGNPKAAYVLYDPKTKEITLRRLVYNIEKTQAKILKVGLPKRLAKRLELGK